MLIKAIASGAAKGAGLVILLLALFFMFAVGWGWHWLFAAAVVAGGWLQVRHEARKQQRREQEREALDRLLSEARAADTGR